ncbi:MAG: pentapeptide repeat-containing protein [Solirubrobacterales bacterium]
MVDADLRGANLTGADLGPGNSKTPMAGL